MKCALKILPMIVGAVLVLTPSAVNAVDVSSLRPYYRYYQVPGTSPASDYLVAGFPPEVRVVGGVLTRHVSSIAPGHSLR